MDAPALASSIAHLNTQATFSPLQALQDTDVAGYLRHAHEQNLISTIEEGRRETQEDFYRVLEERGRHEWEGRKKRVFEQLGARVGGDNRAVAELKKSTHSRNLLSVGILVRTLIHKLRVDSLHGIESLGCMMATNMPFIEVPTRRFGFFIAPYGRECPSGSKLSSSGT